MSPSNYFLLIQILFYEILSSQALLAKSSSSVFYGSDTLNEPRTRFTNRQSVFYNNIRTRSTAIAMPPLMSININRRKIFRTLGGTIVALPLLAEVYARGFRTKISSEPFQDPAKGWDNVKEVTLVFHGAGGQDQYTDELMTQISKQSNDNSYEAIIDWSQYSQNTLRASFNGERIGRQKASQLLSKATSMEKLHVIGISVGAFAANACVTELKEKLVKRDGKSGNVYAQLTLLDPFTQRGALGFNYGNRVFGRSADYAQQFLNTDDPVPSTNSPLSNCAVIDVTNIRPPKIFGHDWPLVYYSRSGKTGFVPPSDRLPKGSISYAKE